MRVHCKGRGGTPGCAWWHPGVLLGGHRLGAHPCGLPLRVQQGDVTEGQQQPRLGHQPLQGHCGGTQVPARTGGDTVRVAMLGVVPPGCPSMGGTHPWGASWPQCRRRRVRVSVGARARVPSGHASVWGGEGDKGSMGCPECPHATAGHPGVTSPHSRWGWAPLAPPECSWGHLRGTREGRWWHGRVVAWQGGDTGVPREGWHRPQGCLAPSCHAGMPPCCARMAAATHHSDATTECPPWCPAVPRKRAARCTPGPQPAAPGMWAPTTSSRSMATAPGCCAPA